MEVNPQENLSESIDASAKKKKNGWLSKFGLLGALLAVTKFGKLAAIAKVLFAALKASKFAATFISMAATVVIYAQFYGWLLALGFIIAIFIHESGHVVASKKVGLDVSAPMFIPFFGAFIAMKELPKSVKQEAISAIGGPVAGALVAAVCLLLWDITGSLYWVGLAYLTAFLNLFNLLPLGMLDGGRITKALSPVIWVIGIVGAVILMLKLHAYILLLVLVLGVMELVSMIKNRHQMATYLQVEPQFRFKIGLAYLLLITILVGMMMYSLDLSQQFIGSMG
ncbi:site-2 protease family protein [Peptococcaceae bacterium 1198_IL3148]